MKNINWSGIMKIKEIHHLDSNGNIIFEAFNIKNLLHFEGEEFLLQAAFLGGRNSTIIPDYYYLGLDNRSLVDTDDKIADLIGEPYGGGYQRAEINSSNKFSLNKEDVHYVATSPIVSFNANSIGGWGPVSNLFLTAEVNGNYKLISTAILDHPITLNDGDKVTMRIGMQIRQFS